MSEPGSVTVWLERLQVGELDAAARQLWEGYFDRLVRLAQKRLRGPQLNQQAEDVALSVFDSFVRRTSAGQFPSLDDRDDLWQILLTMTARKAASLVRKETSDKRGGGQVRDLTTVQGEKSSFDVADPGPDPAEVVAITEECERLLSLLDEKLRRLAIRRLEGFTNAEIATELGMSLSNVERKLAVIRSMWRETANR